MKSCHTWRSKEKKNTEEEIIDRRLVFVDPLGLSSYSTEPQIREALGHCGFFWRLLVNCMWASIKREQNRKIGGRLGLERKQQHVVSFMTFLWHCNYFFFYFICLAECLIFYFYVLSQVPWVAKFSIKVEDETMLRIISSIYVIWFFPQ